MRKAISLLCCSVLFSALPLQAQSLTDYLDELETSMDNQVILIEQLKNSNLSMSSYIAESEKNWDEQMTLFQNLNWVLDDSIQYSKRLEKERNILRIITGALAVSLTTTLIVAGADK